MGENSEAASPLEQLGKKYSKEWPAITKAGQITRARLKDLEALRPFQSDNTAVTVFGSFARGEMTSGSDVDWSLLIDGPADPEHLRIVQAVDRFLAGQNLPKPGTTATFGTLASSHELIHQIGGARDTNENMTRRILLLLESYPVTNLIVHDRVVRGILNRYIVFDASVSWSAQPSQVVPRFLLNDIVRFWRTMAVDYAAKRWEQADKKWALRNAKLRMSRKLLFVAGLLMCFGFELDSPPARDEVLADVGSLAPRLADFFLMQTRRTPIESLSHVLLQVGRPETVSDILDAYDSFLAILDDGDRRAHLEALSFEDAGSSPVFREVRDLSQRFQRGLTNLFFTDSALLRDLIIKYGVF